MWRWRRDRGEEGPRKLLFFRQNQPMGARGTVHVSVRFGCQYSLPPILGGGGTHSTSSPLSLSLSFFFLFNILLKIIIENWINTEKGGASFLKCCVSPHLGWTHGTFCPHFGSTATSAPTHLMLSTVILTAGFINFFLLPQFHSTHLVTRIYLSFLSFFFFSLLFLLNTCFISTNRVENLLSLRMRQDYKINKIISYSKNQKIYIIFLLSAFWFQHRVKQSKYMAQE